MGLIDAVKSNDLEEVKSLISFENAVIAYKAKDYVKSFEMFSALSEKGDATCQANLATMYRDGQGTTVDLHKAAEWFEKAALGGNRVAQVELAILYANGDGVQKDFLKAHAWATVAVSSGEIEAINLRDDFANKLSAMQIVESKQLVDNIFSKIQQTADPKKNEFQHICDIFRTSLSAPYAMAELKKLGFSKWDNTPTMSICSNDSGSAIAVMINRKKDFYSVVYSDSNGKNTTIVEAKSDGEGKFLEPAAIGNKEEEEAAIEVKSSPVESKTSVGKTVTDIGGDVYHTVWERHPSLPFIISVAVCFLAGLVKALCKGEDNLFVLLLMGSLFGLIDWTAGALGFVSICLFIDKGSTVYSILQKIGIALFAIAVIVGVVLINIYK